MRKLFVILLLCAFLLNMGGYMLFFHHRQLTLKKEMMIRIRSGCDQENLEVFDFALVKGLPSDHSFRWEDENEFHYRGKMYDIVERTVVANTLHIICIEDSKEAALLKKLQQVHEKQSSKSAKTRSGIQLLLSSLFMYSDDAPENALRVSSILHYEHYHSSFTLVTKEVITPPPQA